MDYNKTEDFYALLEANENDPDIQYQLGLCYLHGTGVQQDRKAAETWLQRAAQQGHQEATLLLSPAEEPTPDAPAHITADNIADFCLQADDGDADAQYAAAHYFAESSPNESRRYLNMAVEQGHPMACLHLANHYINHRSNTQEIVPLLKNAADCGIVAAMTLLGDGYAAGMWGCPLDSQQAERWFIQAAQQGGAQAKLDLAIRFATGYRVQEQPGQANAWAKRAQMAGIPNAVKQMEVAAQQHRERLHKKALEEAVQAQAEYEAQLKAEADRRAALAAEEARTSSGLPLALKILTKIWNMFISFLQDLHDRCFWLFLVVLILLGYYVARPILSIPSQLLSAFIATLV